MKTIIVLLLINSSAGANNFSMAAIEGFKDMQSCINAAKIIEKRRDSMWLKTECYELPTEDKPHD